MICSVDMFVKIELIRSIVSQGNEKHPVVYFLFTYPHIINKLARHRENTE